MKQQLKSVVKITQRFFKGSFAVFNYNRTKKLSVGSVRRDLGQKIGNLAAAPKTPQFQQNKHFLKIKITTDELLRKFFHIF